MKHILFYSLFFLQFSLFSKDISKEILTVIANENNNETCPGWTLEKIDEIKERKCLLFGTVTSITATYSAIHKCTNNPQQGQVASITIYNGNILELILSDTDQEDRTYTNHDTLMAGITRTALSKKCACIKVEKIK